MTKLEDETPEPHVNMIECFHPFFPRSISTGLQQASHVSRVGALGVNSDVSRALYLGRLRVTENRLRREAKGRKRVPHFSVAHRRVIPRLAEDMVITLRVDDPRFSGFFCLCVWVCGCMQCSALVNLTLREG